MGDSFAVEYAYSYAAGPGWFGLSVMGQTLWLLPVLHGDVHGHAPVRVVDAGGISGASSRDVPGDHRAIDRNGLAGCAGRRGESGCFRAGDGSQPTFAVGTTCHGGEITMEGHEARPLIAITMGDPAGIGPEICLKALLESDIYRLCRPLVLGTLGMLEQMRDVLRSGQHLHLVSSPTPGRYTLGTVDVLDLADEHPGPFPLGVAAKENGAAAVAYVEKAIGLALSGEVDAIATAPLNKEAMRVAGFPYDGHTELLAVKTGTKVYTMMLASGEFRVFHVSTHVSLRGAIERAKKARVLQVIELAYREIQRLGVAEPRLAVAGLNPHAGEHGLFGDEEIHEIAPAVEEARARGWNVSGPISPDTVFARAKRGDFDGVVAMYHDQGHIPFKMTEFELGVNVTVGLPIIRTSVDHGTAYDIAGKGVADPKNMVQAIVLAAEMARRRVPLPQPAVSGRGHR